MNHMDEVARGTFLRAKQEVTVASDLLNWLTGHDIKLPELQQSHLDAWQAEGPTTRRIAERFLKWAIKTKAAPAGLTIVPHRRGTSPRLAKPGQDEAPKRVIDDGLEARDRAAAILILVFGQQAENIARLTWNDVSITEELVTIQLGTIQIALPDPLDKPWRQLAANPRHDLTASHPNTTWVFHGASPGRHIRPGHLTTRLSKLFSTRAARLGTLHELTNAPVAIIAETLGYHHRTPRHRFGRRLRPVRRCSKSCQAKPLKPHLGHVGELFPVHIGDVQGRSEIRLDLACAPGVLLPAHEYPCMPVRSVWGSSPL
ncbi:hypothetical protein [Pseudarthrobacter oxydans]|uniref:hypothetical protein n=1 Tax=Pseudarthrobacter oxydans TaxID=1671 RepID=UPI00344EAE0B